MLKQITGVGLTTLGVGIILLMIAIVVQVLCSAWDINPLITFQTTEPLFGKAVTLNSLLDFQWHLLVLIGLLPAGAVWLMDRHVRVDFYYQTRGPRWKARLNLLGNLFFAVPFFSLVLPAAWDFMLRAWRSDEGSRNGGLNDFWLIKAVLPFGLALLALGVLIETLRLIRAAK